MQPSPRDAPLCIVGMRCIYLSEPSERRRTAAWEPSIACFSPPICADALTHLHGYACRKNPAPGGRKQATRKVEVQMLMVH